MTAKIQMGDRDAAVRKLIGLAGGIKPLAEKLGMAPSSVAGWLQVPIKRVLEIEKAFAGEVTRYEMRPDIFEAP